MRTTGRRPGPRLAQLFLRLAVVAVVLAAARPSVDTAPAQGILTLVVDVSGSTAADDISPTRLQAVQQTGAALLDQVSPELRVGLVSFSEKAQTLTPPTTDHAAVRRELAALSSYGGTAIGDALQLALDDIQAARPAAPATILLVSDGANSSGRDPLDPARTAASRDIRILAVAVGTPGGVLEPPADSQQRTPQAVPPDPAQLTTIATPTNGRVLQAQSADELAAALHLLLQDADLLGERHELTLLLAAAALLLLALATAAPRPRNHPAPTPTPGQADQPRVPAATPRVPVAAALGRWAAAAGLLVAAAATTMLWIQWQPTAPAPSTAAASAVRARPAVPPKQRPPGALLPASIRLDPGAATADRRIVEQAIALLDRHRQLAEHRQAELGRLSHSVPLRLTACEHCQRGSLASPSLSNSRRGQCDVVLHMPVLKQQARRARLPATELAALAILHEQEDCLHHNGATLAPFTAEQRLARKLRHERLFDLLFVQAVAGTRDWHTIQQATATLRKHHELAPQRHARLGRPGRNHTGPLYVTVCRSCLDGQVGDAAMGGEVGGALECNIRLDMAELQAATRSWNLPLHRITASVLTHEQEHCIRLPDDREILPIDAERRLAGKLGDARQLQFATRNTNQLDPTGHWRS